MAMDKASGRPDLVNRIRGGDCQAEAELVERYKCAVMSIIRREVGDAAVADDLYQERFERETFESRINSPGSFAA
jgi:DNA-directed RNA polymerase specialized sigma24 family protein